MPFNKLSNYYYDLPPELIAQYPTKSRVKSKLMILDRNNENIKINIFQNIIEYLDNKFLMVFNKTKVIPARLYGKKLTGGKVEILLLEQLDSNKWKCVVKPGRRLKTGNYIIFKKNVLTGKILKHLNQGQRIIEFSFEGNFFSILNNIGKIPLPPYIKRETEELDTERYQTVFAKERGSAAAPTAGLHFNDNLLKKIRSKGVNIAKVDLKIGLDTFRPVFTTDIKKHKIHKEFCSITPKNADKINKAKRNNKKVLAVGTTTLRTLESFSKDSYLESGKKWTKLFIYPGYEFKMVDALLTNFHLPKSTLLILVSAFAGKDFIMKAYKKAIKEKFRFYSYGDAMLIL